MAENYLKSQEDLADKIIHGKINFKKAPKDRITMSYVETRLETLESQWSVFSNTHRKVVYDMAREEFKATEYYLKGTYDAIEEEYMHYKSLLKDVLAKLKPKAGSESNKACFVKLPDIALPNFSGKYSEWAHYKDLFRSLIHSNGSLDDVQKLHYLKSSLTGEAETLVKSIVVTADNYRICWDRLVARYDNKRSIATSIIRRLMTQKPVTHESASAIRLLLDTTSECLQSLRNLAVNVGSWDLILIYIVSQKLDAESRAKWESKMCESGEELPKYKQLEDFLETRFRSLEYKMTEKHQPPGAPNSAKSSNAATTVTVNCLFCSEKHKLHHCKKFTGESVESRRQFVQTQRLCFNCLCQDHSVYSCTISTNCRICKRRHHTLLHINLKPQQSGKSGPEPKKVVAVVTDTTSPTKEAEVDEETPEVLSSCFSTSRSTVLLATALVDARAQTYSGSASVLRSLLDQGSQASFVTEATVQLLGLRRIKDSVKVSGVGDSRSLESKSSVNVRLTSRTDPSFSINVKAHVLEKLTAVLPSSKVSIDISQMKILPHLELADPSFYQSGGIDLLLGAEVYSKIIMDGLVKSAGGRFIAQKTRLGWVLSGLVQDSVPKRLSEHNVKCNTVTINEDNSDALLKRFWELESEPSLPNKILSKEEMACEELFAATTVRDESGRYIVKLPFKNEDPASRYGGFQTIARKRFLMLERRLARHPNLKSEYSEVINEYLTMEHMEKCSDENMEAVYLPHHAVVREDKDTTKVRVVFDASCKGINGESLNNDLMVGPALQPDLRHLVMRWRCYPISLVADIVKMYRQVKVADEDANYQRIFWRESPSEPLQQFRLLRVTFGTSSAPYLAVRTLQQVAHDEGAHFPEAAHRVLTDFYVDDLMTGCHSVAEGKRVYEQMTQLLNRGGFPLQKWSSNDNELLKSIGGQRSDKNFEIKTDNMMKILGLSWNKETDEFCVKVTLPPLSGSPVTKRMAISDIAKLFDPLGWLAPTVTKAKVFIQKLWLSGIGWDNQLPPDLLTEWLCFRQDLGKIESFSIPRWIRCTTGDLQFELHGFSDASNLAYAAVVYARVVDKDNKMFVNLVTSKTRVAPIKQVSIPRLELCGATLLAKLLNEVGNVLNVPKQNIHAWSDSTIVLAWLSSHPSRWKTFVANRVAEILTTMDGNQWSHVSSEENPADCASRGLQPIECVQNKLWKHGPEWLHNLHIEYTKRNARDTHLEEKKVKTACHVAAESECDEGEALLSRYSSLLKLTRVVSFCRRVLRWKKPEKENENMLGNKLTVKEINESLLTCIRICQKKHFQEEIKSLQSSGAISKKSKIISLNPYLDEHQILRVGGRLQNASLEDDMKHPIIMPHKSHLTHLLIDEAHRRTMHGGPQLMLNYLRSKYWVIGAKSLVRILVHKCAICVRHSRQANQQMMGQLPAARVTAHRPFHRTGVDYAGPISIRTTKGRGHRSTKGYICVFVCMATKAIHLEVVSDLTSEAFLAAFKRFVARRGHVAEMWSDNGTTFVGAARQLTRLFDAESSTVAVEIADWLSSNGTAWHFIPPHSPNFGGLWEAAVKSTKFHLTRVIGTSTLTFEEMATTLAQIEACLNSRPMSQLSSDLNDPCPLTPGHFLVGEPLVLVPDLNYETSTISSLKRWHLIQKMTQDFWRRWSEEYLTQLQHRYKWTDKILEPEIGVVVLIKEDGLPPARWLYGVIVEKHPGQDGLTRVVSLKCKGHIIKRPISKLILLPK